MITMEAQLAVGEPLRCQGDRAGPEGSVSGSELIPEGSLEEEYLERESGFERVWTPDRWPAISPAWAVQGS